MTINLSGVETEMLQEVLEGYLSDLRMEIVNTDRAAYREMLKERRQTLEHILDGVQHAGAQ